MSRGIPHPPAATGIDQLYPVVFGDPGLRDLLLSTRDREQFCARLGRAAAEHRIELSPGQIGDLLDAARRRWLERQT
jgi:hypothetical protein